MDLEYLDELSKQDYYECIIDMPFNKPRPPIKDPVNRVYGCNSDTWVDVDIANDTILYDSASLFVRGMLYVLTSQITSLSEAKNRTMNEFKHLDASIISMQRYRGLQSFLDKLTIILENKYNM